MEINSIITCLALNVIAACALFAVLHRSFDDTTLQCICLGGICLFALGLGIQAFNPAFDQITMQSFLWCLAGFAVETARKITVKKMKHGSHA